MCDCAPLPVHTVVKDPVDLPSRLKVLGWRLAELDLFHLNLHLYKEANLGRSISVSIGVLSMVDCGQNICVCGAILVASHTFRHCHIHLLERAISGIYESSSSSRDEKCCGAEFETCLNSDFDSDFNTALQ
jgi:hypothetical protein